MNRRIILTAAAEAHFDSIAHWYDHREPNLSVRFEAEVYKTLFRIARFPLAYECVWVSVRRAVMNRFRYYIYFTFDARRVFVWAIVHQRRDDPVWLERQDRINRGDP